MILGNENTLRASTGFIVYEGNGAWVVEDEILGGLASVHLHQSTLLYGRPLVSNGAGVDPLFAPFTNGVAFGPVPEASPEPSTSLLACAAGLSLLVRRKR